VPIEEDSTPKKDVEVRLEAALLTVTIMYQEDKEMCRIKL
jgi:hypothetical protein